MAEPRSSDVRVRTVHDLPDLRDQHTQRLHAKEAAAALLKCRGRKDRLSWRHGGWSVRLPPTLLTSPVPKWVCHQHVPNTLTSSPSSPTLGPGMTDPSALSSAESILRSAILASSSAADATFATPARAGAALGPPTV